MNDKISRGSAECRGVHINGQSNCAFGCRSTLARVPQNLRGFPEDAQMPMFLDKCLGELTDYLASCSVLNVV